MLVLSTGFQAEGSVFTKAWREKEACGIPGTTYSFRRMCGSVTALTGEKYRSGSVVFCLAKKSGLEPESNAGRLKCFKLENIRFSVIT